MPSWKPTQPYVVFSLSTLLPLMLQVVSASMFTVLLFISTFLSPISILLAPPAAAASAMPWHSSYT